MLFEKIDTVFIPVQNLEKARNWYVDVLGGKPGWKDENGIYQAVSFGDTSVTLFTNEHELNLQRKYSLFSLYTTSIEKAHAHLTIHSKRVEAIQEAGATYFIFEDPDGNCIEVCSY